MKDDEEIIEIWKEYEKDTLEGLESFNTLTTNEKSRLFDLVADGKHR
jgi:hypothetical protein